MKKKISLAVTALLFTVGFALVLYPLISEMVNHNIQQKVMEQYDNLVKETEDNALAAEWEAPRDYNSHMSSGSVVLSDPFDDTEFLPSQDTYNEMLNIDGDGVMGYIEIPQIEVNLAIYHSTEDEVMRKGAGHLPGTSLPVGGESSHAVISSHRGLPSAKLFTDLDKLKEGDKLYIHVLGETLAYEVDQIKTVEPDDVSDLAIEEGQDYVTLVTCTPYSVNTHRLLVRGTRIEITEAAEKEQLPRRSLPYGLQSIAVALPAAAIVILTLLATRKAAGKPAGISAAEENKKTERE